MDKNVLIQYCDMKEEIKDLRRRITETEKQIFRIAEEGTVKDTVSGGMGGMGMNHAADLRKTAV